MPKHTPGPWKIEYFEGEVSRIYSADGARIVETDMGCYPPYLADAMLIAAAPELLEACKSAMVELALCMSSGPTGMTGIVANKLFNAIKKAENEE